MHETGKGIWRKAIGRIFGKPLRWTKGCARAWLKRTVVTHYMKVFIIIMQMKSSIGEAFINYCARRNSYKIIANFPHVILLRINQFHYHISSKSKSNGEVLIKRIQYEKNWDKNYGKITWIFIFHCEIIWKFIFHCEKVHENKTYNRAWIVGFLVFAILHYLIREVIS